MVVLILAYCHDIADVCRFSRVNKTWQGAFLDDALWQALKDDWQLSNNSANNTASIPTSNASTYLARYQQMLQWTFSNNKKSTITLACKALLHLFVSIHPNDFVTPRYLNKRLVQQHVQQLSRVNTTARQIVNTLSLVLCTTFLSKHVVNRKTLLPLLALQLAQPLAARLEWYLFGVYGLQTAYVYLLGSYYQIPITSILKIIFPLAVLHSMHATLPYMLFDTYAISNDLFALWHHPRTWLAQSYLQQFKYAQILDHWSSPLSMVVGFIASVGGLRFLLELAVLIITYVLKLDLNSDEDDNFYQSSPKVFALLLVMCAEVVLVLLALRQKMKLCHEAKHQPMTSVRRMHLFSMLAVCSGMFGLFGVSYFHLLFKHVLVAAAPRR